jgi:3'(2'), 5'-bisphosphate nucleotidase/inositol polyphosphate 1-phosphatase
MMMDWNDSRIGFALQAVQQAANLAAAIQGEMVTEALTKDDRSPVTVADFAAQAVVGHLLEKAFPGELLVGEEQAAVLRSRQERRTLERITAFVSRVIPGMAPGDVADAIDRGVDDPGDRYWTLDPIDGTKGFLRKAQYACALAYVVDGKVTLGVLGCPHLSPDLGDSLHKGGSLLIASRGAGSWMTSLEGEPSEERFRQLHVSDRTDPGQARLLRSFESGHTNSGLIDEFQIEFGGKADPVRMDSQVKYALLAGGKGEIYLRLLSPDRLEYREKIWDQAAGSILVEEAGGIVTDLDGKPLDFSQGRTLRGNRGICATSVVFHDRALRALRAVKA